MGHTPVVQYAVDLQFLVKNCVGINKFRDKVLYFFKDGSNDFVIGVTYDEIRECMENQTIPEELKTHIK